MTASPLQRAATALVDHPGERARLKLSDSADVASLMEQCASEFAITSRDGFHVLVKHEDLALMLHCAEAASRDSRFEDDGSPTRWITSDPTADKAVRRLLHGGGPFLLTPGPSQNPGVKVLEVRVSKEKLAAMCLGMQSRLGRKKKNRQGKWRQHLWLDPIPSEKNNPTAVEFGDRNSGGVHTENTFK